MGAEPDRCNVCKAPVSCGGTFIDNPPDQTLYFCESHSLLEIEKELLDHLDLELGTYCTCKGDCRFW